MFSFMSMGMSTTDYYLADGIYLEWAAFMKAIPLPLVHNLQSQPGLLHGPAIGQPFGCKQQLLIISFFARLTEPSLIETPQTVYITSWL
jgi:hypothetical protein